MKKVYVVLVKNRSRIRVRAAVQTSALTTSVENDPLRTSFIATVCGLPDGIITTDKTNALSHNYFERNQVALTL
jgi:hypothetical protein